MRGSSRALAVAGYLTAAVLVAAGAGLLAQSAGAVVIDDGDGGFTLDADPYLFQHAGWSPGSTADWLITAQHGGPDDADLTLQLDYSGALTTSPAGLHLLLQECPVPFAGGACAAAAVTLHDGPYATASTAVRHLGRIAAGGSRYFLARFSLPLSAPDAMQGQEAFFGFRFVAGDDLTPAGDPGDSEEVTSLPATGPAALDWPLLLGPALLIGGLLVAGLTALRQRVGDSALRAAAGGPSRSWPGGSSPGRSRPGRSRRVGS